MMMRTGWQRHNQECQILMEKRFYFSLALLQVSLQLATRLGEAPLNNLARRLYHDPSWLGGLHTDSSLSGFCWKLGEGASSSLTKHFLLLLSGELLAWADQDKAQLLRSSLPVGLQALAAADWSDFRVVRTKLEESLDLLEEREDSSGSSRLLTLVKFRLAQATEGACKWDPCVLLSDLIRNRDQVGLLTLSKMTSEDPRYIDVNLTALSEALKLEKTAETNREMLTVANLEVMAEVPTSGKVFSLTSHLNSLTWTERSLLTEALKLTWNIWVTVTSYSEPREVCSAWFEAMSVLHNKATEPCDHIICRLDKPTPGRICSKHVYLLCFSFYQNSCQGSSRKSRGVSTIFL